MSFYELLEEEYTFRADKDIGRKFTTFLWIKKNPETQNFELLNVRKRHAPRKDWKWSTVAELTPEDVLTINHISDKPWNSDHASVSVCNALYKLCGLHVARPKNTELDKYVQVYHGWGNPSSTHRLPVRIQLHTSAIHSVLSPEIELQQINAHVPKELKQDVEQRLAEVRKHLRVRIKMGVFPLFDHPSPYQWLRSTLEEKPRYVELNSPSWTEERGTTYEVVKQAASDDLESLHEVLSFMVRSCEWVRHEPVNSTASMNKLLQRGSANLKRIIFRDEGYGNRTHRVEKQT